MRLKLAGALIATLLVFGLVFGAGQAAAASLPGDPLYGLKLVAEQARLELTTDPEAKAELATQLAENRLGEIAQMMAEGDPVNREIAFKAQEQLMWAYQATYHVQGEVEAQARHRLTHMVQNRQLEMASAVETSSLEQEPVRALIRSMVRVQAELQTGEGTGVQTGDRQYPELSEPAGQSGAGMQAGQQDGDGLLDGSGAQTGQGDGQGDGSYSWGYGSENPGEGSPYEGEGPDYGPGPGESQEDEDAPAGPFGWFLGLFQKDTTPSGDGTSGSGASGNGASGSGSSGSGTSGSGSSGSDSTDSSSPGTSSPGTGTPGGKH